MLITEIQTLNATFGWCFSSWFQTWLDDGCLGIEIVKSQKQCVPGVPDVLPPPSFWVHTRNRKWITCKNHITNQLHMWGLSLNEAKRSRKSSTTRGGVWYTIDIPRNLMLNLNHCTYIYIYYHKISDVVAITCNLPPASFKLVYNPH